MLKFYLAIWVIEKRITLEKAKEIEQELGNKPLPTEIEEIVEQIERLL